MNNQFYNDFDLELLEGKIPQDYRTVFQRERDCIIHISALCRL